MQWRSTRERRTKSRAPKARSNLECAVGESLPRVGREGAAWVLAPSEALASQGWGESQGQTRSPTAPSHQPPIQVSFRSEAIQPKRKSNNLRQSNPRPPAAGVFCAHPRATRSGVETNGSRGETGWWGGRFPSGGQCRKPWVTGCTRGPERSRDQVRFLGREAGARPLPEGWPLEASRVVVKFDRRRH